jgi:rifampicin phosphotransferase
MVADRWITDSTPSPRYPLYTRANAGEVLPEPASPLGWTLVWEPGVVRGWHDSQLRLGTPPEELDPDEVVGCFGGYLYLNASLARLFGVRAPGLSPEMIDFTYFGEHPDVPAYVAEPWHENNAATARLQEWMGSVLFAEDLPELRDERDLAARSRASRPDLRSAGDHELLERSRSLVPLVRRLFDRHLEMTAACSIGSGVLSQVASAMGDPSLALTLITSVGDVDSALPSHAMWELSRLDPASDEYADRFQTLVHDFGSRGPNEWDIRSHTWETAPELAHSLVEVMRRAGDAENPQARNQRNAELREAATDQVRSSLADQPETVAQFDAALRSAHLHMAGRERAKTNVIKVIHEIRMAIWELGNRHAFAPSEVCMLLADELDAFVEQSEEFRSRVLVREEQYEQLRELEPPFIVNGSVPPLSQWPKRTTEAGDPAVSGDVLHGVPGSPGTVTGQARVIRDAADPTALHPGEILIAPLTDPAWTPMFVAAAGVVVNVGAQVSHAVIVSRELGLPCVVSVHGATDRIPDGATITVDGSAGTVTIH